ncbi:glycosyltransferase family 69 protein [Dactylonectria macrodidyma]|uniref:Glycosyltransferase family 69 protein n=1 Tax=Dactylonectria macrodidyma TaxID=307937 RepID=A0A9P9FPF4_9HYPO|nr:glycosyltransferase family 69 protein [Dactylonectria macrodidyma]
MILSQGNRFYLRRLLRSRTIKILLLLACLINVVDVLRIHRDIADAERTPAPRLSQPPERIYIASMHWNNGKILRHHWNDAVIKLTELFGPENVFVSIYESGSWDDSKEVLRELDGQLERRGVLRRIELSATTHHDEIAKGDQGEGWIKTSRGTELRRIPYLAKLRNKTIRDLVELHENGTTFDKVLFLNDVVFTTDDVLKLLNTNGGEYAAACSLDFSKPPLYYDTFALRDTQGEAHAMQTWPYLHSSASRNALVNHVDAVPVKSCWNGIVAMPAEPFISSSALRFRAVTDSLASHHLEGSECCLIHADNPLSKTRGVFLNPHVRVGYNLPAYQATHPASDNESWLSVWDIFFGLWVNRLRRWTALPFERWVVRRRVGQWKKEGLGRREPGEFCLINEMQVVIDNGWAHV